MEGGGRRTEGGGWKAEDGGRRAEDGRGKREEGFNSKYPAGSLERIKADMSLNTPSMRRDLERPTDRPFRRV